MGCVLLCLLVLVFIKELLLCVYLMLGCYGFGGLFYLGLLDLGLLGVLLWFRLAWCVIALMRGGVLLSLGCWIG